MSNVTSYQQPRRALGRLRVVCAWCGRVLSSGDRDAATSHGACEVCADRLLHEDD